jgi:hypothetical protein
MRGSVIAVGTCGAVRECVAPGGQTGLRPCVRSGSFSKRAERNGRRASWVLAANSASPVRALTRLERAKRHARCGRRRDWSGGSGLRRGVSKPRWTRYLRCVQHSDRRGDTVQTDVTHSGWKTPNARAAPRVSRTIPNARMGEALFGRQELHTPAPARNVRERSRTHAWAKPCLAGRPTTLVRTQSPVQNTSRGRPSGTELPDYPVVALTPVRRTRMGPHLRFPPGLFPYS